MTTRIHRTITIPPRFAQPVWMAATVCAVLATADAATAQVTFYGAQKTAFYDQTANNTAPTAAINYSEFGFVNTQDAGDADSFTVSDNGSIALTSSVSNPTSFGGSTFYETKSALDTDFTAGDLYTFTAQGGTLDGQSGSLPIGTDAYPALLYLTGSGYSDSMAVSPSEGFTFSLGSAGGEAGATGLSFSLYDAKGNQVYTVNDAAGTASITLSKATIDSLTPGEVYTATLNNFSTENATATGAFTNAPNSDGFVTATNFAFEVVPEPGQVAILLTGLAGLAATRKRRAARRQA